MHYSRSCALLPVWQRTPSRLYIGAVYICCNCHGALKKQNSFMEKLEGLLDMCLWGGRRRRTRRGTGPGQAPVAGPAPAEPRPTPPTTAAPVPLAAPAASAAVPAPPPPTDGVLRAQTAARRSCSEASHDFMRSRNEMISQSPFTH